MINFFKKRTEYVCGLCFDMEYNNVVLITKNRPSWQKGKLNGVGGKIQRDEFPPHAMAREFYEETGLTVQDWTPICTISGDGYFVFIYSACAHYASTAMTKTDEVVRFISVDRLREYNHIPGLEWVIPLAIYRSKKTEEKIKIT